MKLVEFCAHPVLAAAIANFLTLAKFALLHMSEPRGKAADTMQPRAHRKVSFFQTEAEVDEAVAVGNGINHVELANFMIAEAVAIFSFHTLILFKCCFFRILGFSLCPLSHALSLSLSFVENIRQQTHGHLHCCQAHLHSLVANIGFSAA